MHAKDRLDVVPTVDADLFDEGLEKRLDRGRFSLVERLS